MIFFPQKTCLNSHELIELKQRELYEFVSKNRAFDELIPKIEIRKEDEDKLVSFFEFNIARNVIQIH